jgi:hypothetical protein
LYIKDYARDYASKNTTDKIKEPEIEISTLFSIQSEFIDEFYNIFKFISESVISNRYYDEEVLKEFIFNENVIKSKKTTNHILYDKEFTRLSIIYLDTHLQFSCIKIFR